MDSQKYLGIPSGVYIISDLETLRVVADPLRLQVLALLRRRPATVKQLASELSLPPKKLYLGTSVTGFILPLLIFKLTDSALSLALATVFTMLPYPLLCATSWTVISAAGAPALEPRPPTPEPV